LILAVGFFAWAVVVYGWVPGLNAMFDASRAQEHQVRVVRQYRRKGWMLEVESWGRAGTTDLYVPNALGDARPSVVIVTTHAGALGFEWVSNVRFVR